MCVCVLCEEVESERRERERELGRTLWWGDWKTRLNPKYHTYIYICHTCNIYVYSDLRFTTGLDYSTGA